MSNNPTPNKVQAKGQSLGLTDAQIEREATITAADIAQARLQARREAPELARLLDATQYEENAP